MDGIGVYLKNIKESRIWLLGRSIFRQIKRLYKESMSLVKQFYELTFLSRGKYAPNHPDNEFFNKYYYSITDKPDNEESSLNPVHGIICMCDGRQFHGGPTDRIRGILTTYREAKKMGIPFFINWTHPFQLENYLVPATFDWTINPNQISYYKKDSFPFIIEDEPDFQSFLRMKLGLKMWRPQIHVYSNADNGRGEYSNLYKDLFKPSEKLQGKVEYHLSHIGAKYWAFTFRFRNLLGDFKDWWQEELTDDEKVKFMERVSAEMLKIARKIPKGYRILVTSDSRLFLDYVDKLDSRIYVVPGEVKNIDLSEGKFPDAWMKTFVDQQLLMHAEKVFLMRTGSMFKSGFPRFAAEVGGVEFIDHKF